MLSSERRPVQTIATDENGLPRWVMCQWEHPEGQAPERVLLLHRWRRIALIYVPGEPDSGVVDVDLLHECPPD